MYYTTESIRNASADFEKMLIIPSHLTDFVNSGTSVESTRSGTEAYCFHGDLYFNQEDYRCKDCGCGMHIHNKYSVRLRHLCIGGRVSFVMFDKHRFICPECGRTKMQEIPFKAEHHQITLELQAFTMDLLRNGYTNRQVSQLTGLGEHIVKAIDMERLKGLYTEQIEDHLTLQKPEKQATYLVIDEFKLHNGYKYATHIIDLETGHILWIQEGKKKQVVYDFIDHVGLNWMSGVKAVACDMNSDFQEAFQEKCPHIRIVFDRFHIIKNFNDKVIGAVRKDEQHRLKGEGDEAGAKALKHSRYILTSSRSRLAEKDRKASEYIEPNKEHSLFPHRSAARKGGNEERYEQLIQSNKLLLTTDLVKEMLEQAYQCTEEDAMEQYIVKAIETCKATNNKHFLWFARLLEVHREGIIAYAATHITSGRIEGINNKIKTLRR